tara:strand:- start:334 stop:516 length:183 start_codon:yes stop_codon:yes gene_type:complete
MIDKKLLDILVCPKSKSSLKLVGEELLSYESKLAYPIRDGIPVMLETEARKLADTELEIS